MQNNEDLKKKKSNRVSKLVYPIVKFALILMETIETCADEMSLTACYPKLGYVNAIDNWKERAVHRHTMLVISHENFAHGNLIRCVNAG